MFAISGLKKIETTQRPSLVSSFITWTENQEKNRLAWLGIAITGHGCLITPLTALVVMATTQSFVLFMAAIASMTISLVTNLAALPTKITIPAFFLSIAMDLVIIAIRLSSLL